MRVVFFGTPQFAVTPLKKLVDSRHEVVAVISQPDRAKDRKGRLLPTPLKVAASELGIKVLQFESVKNEVELLKGLSADIFVTAAYGQILNQAVLDIAPHGVINIHGSLLPKYRGSSPVQHAVLHGDRVTGITIMKTELGLDSGDIILQGELAIGADTTSAELMDSLANLGGELLVEALDKIEDGSATFTPQDHEKATKCGKITKESTRIDWSQNAQSIHNRVRATEGYTFWGDKLIKILKTRVCDDIDTADLQAGEALKDEALKDKRLIVACGKGAVEVLSLLPSGGKVMSGADFLKGVKDALIFK